VLRDPVTWLEFPENPKAATLAERDGLRSVKCLALLLV
jgi:hypothetical protein